MIFPVTIIVNLTTTNFVLSERFERALDSAKALCKIAEQKKMQGRGKYERDEMNKIQLNTKINLL